VELAYLKKLVIGGALMIQMVINCLKKLKFFSICNIKYDPSEYEILVP
jgi:hypothetical protein